MRSLARLGWFLLFCTAAAHPALARWLDRHLRKVRAILKRPSVFA